MVDIRRCCLIATRPILPCQTHPSDFYEDRPVVLVTRLVDDEVAVVSERFLECLNFLWLERLVTEQRLRRSVQVDLAYKQIFHRLTTVLRSILHQLTDIMLLSIAWLRYPRRARRFWEMRLNIALDGTLPTTAVY
jgi:hypothetical protein